MYFLQNFWKEYVVYAASRQQSLSCVCMEMGAFRLMILISSYFYFRYFLQGAPIVLSDSEEEEMIILEPDKNPKKIR